MIAPNRDIELELLERYDLVIGMDEVGRGALAGPVAVGAAVVSRSCGDAPSGLADSKLLSAARREALVAPVRGWCKAKAVGWSSPEEISRLGISGALRLAGLRSIEVLSKSLGSHFRSCVLLDGNHNWLQAPQADLFWDQSETLAGIEERSIDVAIRIKADRDASVVAAASVLAKVARDRFMSSVADPGYDWSRNKGYSSPSHIRALQRLGPSGRHRTGWNLPGVGTAAGSTTGYRMDEGEA